MTSMMAAPKLRSHSRRKLIEPGRHSMKARGWDGTEEHRARLEVQSIPGPGTWCQVPAAAVLDRRLGRCTSFHVLAWLAKYRNFETGQCNPSVVRMARELGIGRRTVQRHMNKLIRLGHLVAIPQRRRNGGWTSN